MEDYLLAKLIRRFITPIAIIIIAVSMGYAWLKDDPQAGSELYLNIAGFVFSPITNLLENRVERIQERTNKRIEKIQENQNQLSETKE